MHEAENCFHCELPLGHRFVDGVIDGVPRRFCCYGCLLAQQVTRASGEPGAAASILIRLGLGLFCAMNVMAFSLPTYAPYVYGSSAVAGDGPLFQILRLLSAAFALPVILLLGGPIILAAARGLREGQLTADALIVLGASAAYGLSLAHVFTGRGEVYFDTAAMLLVIVTIGRYLEARAKADAGVLVKAVLSRPPAFTVRLVGGRPQTIACEQLAPGDVVRVVPGDAFPTDGLILRGEGLADEAALTGESRPVHKVPGSSTAGGTCSIDGTFEVLVTARQRDSAAACIADLLARALRQRGRLQRLADRAARILIPGVVAVAVIAGVGWAATAGWGPALMVSLAVLVVACPCALGIATPAAMWMGLLAAARRGVIIRDGCALERAAMIDRVLFDKTGTLTNRVPVLERAEVAPGCGWTPEQALAIAGLLEENVEHPMARALVAAARGVGHESGTVSRLKVVPGKGVRGRVGGEQLTIGSSAFAREDLSPVSSAWLQGLAPSVIVLWNHTAPLAAFSFAESLHPTADRAIKRLRGLHLGLGVLSGDQSLQAVVPALISGSDAHCGLSAARKLETVRNQRRTGAVAMVGDGLNDAPALAAADLGIAIGAATDLTRVSADIVIVDHDLTLVPWLLGHARRVRRIMLQNLAWAGGYNLVAVSMAAFGKLNPLIAAMVMVGSSLLVVANARRLLRWREIASGDSQWCESRPAIFTDPSKRAVRVRDPSKESERHDP